MKINNMFLYSPPKDKSLLILYRCLQLLEGIFKHRGKNMHVLDQYEIPNRFRYGRPPIVCVSGCMSVYLRAESASKN